MDLGGELCIVMQYYYTIYYYSILGGGSSVPRGGRPPSPLNAALVETGGYVIGGNCALPTKLPFHFVVQVISMGEIREGK